MKESPKNMIKKGIPTGTLSHDVYRENRDAVELELGKIGTSHVEQALKANVVLETLDRIGSKSEMMPSLGPVKAGIISDLIKKYKPTHVLEIGTLFGYSATLVSSHLGPDSHVITIEANEKNAELAERVFKLAGVDDKVSLILGDALKVIPTLQNEFDFVIIDGNKEQYLKYIRAMESHLPKGSVVVADNVGVFKSYVKEYLDYMRSSGNYKSSTIDTKFEFTDDIYDAIEVSIKIR